MSRMVVTWIGVAVMSGLSILYLANTFLYLTPPNPLTLQLWPIVHKIQQPFFVQNWHLFAPNPLRTNLVLTVRCRFGEKVTQWRDPVTPLLARHHKSRISPMGRMIRIPQNAMYLFFGWTSDEWRRLLCRRTRDHPACHGENQSARRARALGQFVLHRIASATCDEVVGDGRASRVQARILIHEPPPWSRRHMPSEEGSTKYIALPWLPYVPSTSPEAMKGRSL